jgi:hypothetical protein
LGFIPVPPIYLFTLGLIVVLYATAVEIAKKIFYEKTMF